MISGNIAKYCSDDISKIENYEQAVKDNTQIWDCHHRRETIYDREGLIEIGEYYNRPAEELIFLTKLEHMRVHHKGKSISKATRDKLRAANIGKKLTAEHRLNISMGLKGHKSALKGRKLSYTHRLKIALASRGHKHSEETKAKIGKPFWNNGTICIRAKEQPDETWSRGRLPYTRTSNK